MAAVLFIYDSDATHHPSIYVQPPAPLYSVGACPKGFETIYTPTNAMGMLYLHNDIFVTDIIGCDRMKFS